LEQAAAYMETRQMAAGSYLHLYQTRWRELMARAEPPDAYQATITTTWNIGFEQVQKVPGAAELLALCCFLAPDSIPLPLLVGSLARVERLRAAGLEDDLVRADALTALRRYALLSGSEANLTIHRLVQQVYRDQMSQAEAQRYLSAATELIIAVLPDGTRLHEWAEGQQLLPHMVAASDLATVMTWESEPAAFLANWTGYYLHFLANYSQARPYFQRALAIREKALGPDHPDTATSLNNLGALLDSMGNLAEARPYYQRALAIREKALGPDHPDTALSYWWLGVLAEGEGQLAEARALYAKTLAVYQQTLGDDHPTTQSVRQFLQKVS
jgi:tetratricopeptide (TPR) repeat protein